MEINEKMIENSSLTETPEIQSSPETEDYQEPEIELPLPVIVALQEREARRQNSEEEFAGAAPLADSVSHASSVPEERADVRSSKSRNKQEQEEISLSHHSPRCTICNHPEREAIEQGFLHWESPTLLAYEYDLGQRRAVYRHARAFGLFEKRAARTRRSLEFVIEQGETITPTADSLIRAVRAYSCLGEDGRWTEPTKRVIITHEHIDRRAPDPRDRTSSDDFPTTGDYVDSNGMPRFTPQPLGTTASAGFVSSPITSHQSPDTRIDRSNSPLVTSHSP
ncbi:MAG TPA: hypothetical protein VFW94_02335, partial [Candidatus Acidoferrales bacterium]|nr:hypothetical protein [Candidatus Acidoferrales bacterium]